MNESLAKQLHNLIRDCKLSIDLEVRCELNRLEVDVNELIENNKNTQEKPNE